MKEEIQRVWTMVLEFRENPQKVIELLEKERTMKEQSKSIRPGLPVSPPESTEVQNNTTNSGREHHGDCVVGPKRKSSTQRKRRNNASSSAHTIESSWSSNPTEEAEQSSTRFDF
jgi:hypothetical protein